MGTAITGHPLQRPRLARSGGSAADCVTGSRGSAAIAAAGSSGPRSVSDTASLPGPPGTQERTRGHTERLAGSRLQGLGGTQGTQDGTRGATERTAGPYGDDAGG